MFTVNVPIGSVNIVDRVLCLQINAEKVMKQLAIVNASYKGATAIVETSGRVILAPDAYTGLFEKILSMSENDSYTIDGQNLLVNRAQTTVEGWQYISIVFEQDLFSRMMDTRDLMLIAGIVCAAAGIVLSLLFSSHNAKPMQRLQAEHDKMSTQLLGYTQELLEGYLLRLLKGYSGSSLPEGYGFAPLLRRLDNEWKVVLLISILTDQGTMKPLDIGGDLDDSWRILTFPIEDYIGGIVLCGTDEPKAEKLAVLMENIYRREINYVICIGYSQAYRQIDMLPIAYEQAKQALEYKQLTEGEGVMNIKSVPEYADPSNISLRDQIKLQNVLKAGNYDEAEKIFDDIIVCCFSESSASSQIIKCHMFTLINTLIMSLPETNIAGKTDCKGEWDPIGRLLACTGVKELVNESKGIFNHLRKQTDVNRSHTMEQQLVEMEQMILEHYRDPNFSVTVMADHFNMHPSYLSRRYKALTKVGILDRIHQLRIAEAKRLILCNHISIKESGRLVGYNNELAFFRAFKRMEGTTPGQYRSGVEGNDI